MGPEGTPRAPPRAPPRGGLRPLSPASRAGRRSGSGGRGRPGVPPAGAVLDPGDGLGHPWRLTGAEPERAGASHPRRLQGTGWGGTPVLEAWPRVCPLITPTSQADLILLT